MSVQSTENVFKRIRSFTSKTFPELKRVKLYLGCREVESKHQEVWRHIAHTGHIPFVICIARDFIRLPKKYSEGILFHEFGHIISVYILGIDNPAPKHISKPAEKRANKIVEHYFGIRLRYDPSFHYLQYIKN